MSFVVEDSIKVEHIDLALDIAAPYQALVLFEKKRDRGSAHRAVWTHWDMELATTGTYFGTRSSPIHVCAYDKSKELRTGRSHSSDPDDHERMEPQNSTFQDERVPGYVYKPIPEHMRGMHAVTRIEFRFRPGRIKLDRSPTDVLTRLPKSWAGFALADLREARAVNWRTLLVAFAQRHGASARPSTIGRLRRIKTLLQRRDAAWQTRDWKAYRRLDGTTRGGVGSGKAHRVSAIDRIANAFSARLPKNSSMGVEVAQVLQREMFAELESLADASGFDLAQTMETQLSRVQADLDSALRRSPAPRRS